MVDFQKILKMVEEFNKYGSNPDIKKHYIPFQLKEKHFHEENSIQNSPKFDCYKEKLKFLYQVALTWHNIEKYHFPALFF